MVLREGGNRLGAAALAEPEYGDCHRARPGRRLIGWSRPNAGYSTLGWYDNANGDVAVSITGSGVWRWEDATGWRELSPADAMSVSIAGNGIVAANIPGLSVRGSPHTGRSLHRGRARRVTNTPCPRSWEKSPVG